MTMRLRSRLPDPVSPGRDVGDRGQESNFVKSPRNSNNYWQEEAYSWLFEVGDVGSTAIIHSDGIAVGPSFFTSNGT